jgi:hypothetical protein
MYNIRAPNSVDHANRNKALNAGPIIIELLVRVSRNGLLWARLRIGM